MENPSLINIYFTIDKSLMVSDHNKTIIGNAINLKYNKGGNKFNIDANTGFINFKLNTHGFPIQSKLYNASDAENALIGHLKTFDSKIESMSLNKKYSNASKLLKLFPDYFVFYSTKRIDDGFSQYGESIIMLELETSLSNKNYKTALHQNNYILVKYNEYLIIELDYSFLPIAYHIQEPCLINFNQINLREFVLFYENSISIDSNMIIPTCFGFNEKIAVTRFHNSSNVEIKTNSNDKRKYKINSYLFEVLSFMPKTQILRGAVDIKCSVQVVIVDVGNFRVEKSDLINEENINSIFNSIYSSNEPFALNAKNQNNYIYTMQFSNTLPPVALNEVDRSKVGQLNFADYYEVKLKFDFKISYINNFIEALDIAGRIKRDSNLVMIFGNKSENRISEFSLDSSVFDYIILQNANEYCGKKVNVGQYYERLSINPVLLNFLIKYQIDLSPSEGIEIYNYFDNLISVTRVFHSESRRLYKSFAMYSDESKTFAVYLHGTKLIFVNPNYESDQNFKGNAEHFNHVIAHELYHFLSQIQHKNELDYPKYTMHGSPGYVRANETDMLNMLISNWDSPLFIIHD